MFRLNDNFQTYDKNKQPYSFRVERHTETDNCHAGVTENGFSLKSVGNRHILNTPKFHTGIFFMEFKASFLKESDTEFILMFQYQEEVRKGQGVRVRAKRDGILELELVSIAGSCVCGLVKQSFSEFYMKEDCFFPLRLELTEDKVICCVDTKEAVFSCVNRAGRIAIERGNFVGELMIKHIVFESQEEFSSRIVIPKTTVEIPCVNGGDIPYKLTWEMAEIEGEFYLRCALDGGTKTRALNREDRLGQYVAEIDHMEDPYVGIRNFGSDLICNLSEGSNCFVDPNVFWECLKDYFGDTQLPLQACYRVDISSLDEHAEIIFGYKELSCSGYQSQCGGNEFRFDTVGQLIYNGASLDGRDIFTVYSPFDKLAVSLIPKECYKREDVVEHFKYNHYFDVSEKPFFTLEFLTRKDSEYFTVRAFLLNVFETQTIAECTETVEITKELWRNGYTKILAQVAFDFLPVGVYKVSFEILYGEKIYQKVIHVFEVFDRNTDVNPALATGLPFVFSMPNELKWLERNSFDAWNPARSCDMEHFITCVTDTPIEAERRRTWELIKIFKREWFAWLGPRTCNDYLSDRHKDVLLHADYLFFAIDSGSENWLDAWLGSCSIFPFRADHWTYSKMENPFQKNLLAEFFETHPEALEMVDYEPNSGKMSHKAFQQFMKAYRKPWMQLISERMIDLFEQQNRQIKSLNPGVRRSMYGPVFQYSMPATSAHTLPLFGLPCDERLFNTIYTGFAIFEDYPYSCAYQTYRGPFAVMTMLLHAPGLVVYPEQYKGSRGGCIDGAVKFAHSPMGKYDVEAYQNSTHAFEYVYNTPYRSENGFHYWDTYGFHRNDYKSSFMNQLILDWEHVVISKPSRPLRALAFLAEYSASDDVFRSYDCGEGEWKYTISNKSEAASGLIHECSRLAGVPNGFALKFDTLKSLSAKECDLLVVASLKEASEEQIAEIRRLYEEGVNLIAVSDVTGLEDLFGVKEQLKTVLVNDVSYEGKTEYVYGMEATFQYVPNKAEVIMTANGTIPAILRTSRTALINTDVANLGSEEPRKVNCSNANHIVGRTIYSALKDEIRRLSHPLVFGENVGVTLFETQDGRTEVLAIDYALYDNQNHEEREAVLRLNLEDVTDVKSKKELLIGKKKGVVKEVRFGVKPHESVFLELCKKD